MSADPLNKKTSDRICRHMNDDHTDAIVQYAQHFGCVKNPKKARMISISTATMKLEVDGQTIEIPFDHSLSDSEDAHQTLVKMLRSIPKNSP